PAKPGLPKVVYVKEFTSQLNLDAPSATWYGLGVTDWMPFYAHPNELLDGAYLPNAMGLAAVRASSWEQVNNPVVEGLYSLHGTKVDFVGVIMQRTRFEIFEEKQLSANQTAKLAKQLGADGAIMTMSAAGNAFIEGMLTIQALEKVGIKTSGLLYEQGGKEGKELPLIYTVPEADAL